jgi:8-oxo-dGTP diphosphatase
MYRQALQEAREKGHTISVVAKISDGNGNILLIKRTSKENYGGIWELPGGGVEKGEVLENALKRETKEETGLTVKKIVRYAGYFDFHNIETGKNKRKFCFEILTIGEVSISHEHELFKWFTQEEIKKLKVQSEYTDYEIWDDHYRIATS